MSDEKTEVVEIDISDKDFLIMAKIAHEKDITFNQYVNQVMKEFLDRESKKQYPDQAMVNFL